MLSPNDLSPNGKAASVWSLDSGYGTSMADDENAFQSVHVTAPPPHNSFPAQQTPKTVVGLGLQGLGDGPWVCSQTSHGVEYVNLDYGQFGLDSAAEGTPTGTSLFANPSFDANSDFFQRINQNASTIGPSSLLSSDSSPKSKAFLPKLDIPLSDEIKRSRAGRNSKLPQHALNCLQNWLSANQHNPYPSAETKRALAQECGITEKQVTTWFTNARARQLSPLGASPASVSEGEVVDEVDASMTPADTMGGFTFIPEGRRSDTYARTASVPEASIFSPSLARQPASRRGKKKNYRRNHSQSDPPASVYASLPPSTINPPEELFAAQHGQSSTTQRFDTSSYSSIADIPPNDSPSKAELWQCTFCRKHLVPKSWRRHEETQHRPKAQWTCMLRGPSLLFPSSQSGITSKCAFCMMVDPPEDHYQKHHRIEECAKRDRSDRTFFRPDHLRQHVKNFHGTGLFDIVQARWKSAAEAGAEGWTCGFCGEKLDTWDKRETHIANHFKDGMRMESWQDYPNTNDKSSKRGKGKRKERAQSQMSGMGRLGPPFMHQVERNSFALDNAPHQQQQPQPPQPSHHPHHHQSRQQQQQDPQQFYQGNFPHPQPLTQPARQPSIASTYQPISFSNPFSLPQTQHPIIPVSTPLEPVLLESTDPFNWQMATSTAAPLATTTMQQPTTTTQQPQPQPYQQLGYPLPSTSAFDANMNSTAFQQQFDRSLQSMGLTAGVDMYGNPLPYQNNSPWEGQ